MSNLWRKEFRAENIKKPKEILDEQCRILSNMTHGKIIAKTDIYEGAMHSYKTSFAAALSPDKIYNVQKDLGEIQGSKFRYEFYITSIMTPNFKYRAMLFEYDITFYPVSITLDETIANELASNTYIECNTIQDFKEWLKKILNSKKIENVINALLSLEINQNAQDDDEQITETE